MHSNSSDKKEAGKVSRFLFDCKLLPITLNYRKYKIEVIWGCLLLSDNLRKSLILSKNSDFGCFPILFVYFHENTHRTMYHVMTSIGVFGKRL